MEEMLLPNFRRSSQWNNCYIKYGRNVTTRI